LILRFLLAVFIFIGRAGAEELTLPAAIEWLHQQAIRCARGSIIKAHEGTSLFTPDGSAHYQALWTRDFFYLLEGCPEGLSEEEARACFLYLLKGQREDGAMPDRVQADGLAVYIPGPVGAGIGPLPALDNPAFMVKIMDLLLPPGSSEELYLQSCEALARGLEFPKTSPSGLLWVDPGDPHSSFGFFDTIFLTGEVFFASVLQWEAYKILAKFETRIGKEENARAFQMKADQLFQALQKFWEPSSGMFRAASQDCNQIDIWGSAYSVYSGLANTDQARRIAEYLIKNHSHLMQRGQLRHCAPGEYWQRSLTPRNQYQNGGYWATPFGWWFAAVHPLDKNLAEKTFHELVQDFRTHGIHEWILEEKSAVPDYVASACQPLVGLRRCGYPLPR